MRRMTQMLAIAGLACVASFGSNKAWAQQDNAGRRGFDPARAQEFQQRRMDRLKEELEVKDDEWAALQPLIQKVMDAQRAVMADRIGGFMRGGRGGGGGDTAGGGGDNGGRRRGGGGGFGGFGEPSPEAEALQKAIESKASNSEMKAALAKYQESRKTKQADLETAQANLKKVLSVRQEAILTAQGVL
jgi:Beta-propeller domains of methanol dehydrogenase type